MVSTPWYQRKMDVVEENTSSSSSPTLNTTTTSLTSSSTSMYQSLSQVSEKVFFERTHDCALHKETLPRQSFNESHVVRWKQTTNYTSSSSMPYFPSNRDWSYEDYRYACGSCLLCSLEISILSYFAKLPHH